jgi:hypothetical protein
MCEVSNQPTVVAISDQRCLILWVVKIFFAYGSKNEEARAAIARGDRKRAMIALAAKKRNTNFRPYIL